jgi:hypothetical protein
VGNEAINVPRKLFGGKLDRFISELELFTAEDDICILLLWIYASKSFTHFQKYRDKSGSKKSSRGGEGYVIF